MLVTVALVWLSVLPKLGSIFLRLPSKNLGIMITGSINIRMLLLAKEELISYCNNVDYI